MKVKRLIRKEKSEREQKFKSKRKKGRKEIKKEKES